MEQFSNILNELKEANSILAYVEKVLPYTVPVDYFANFSSNIHAAIFVESIGSANPYIVDEYYFDFFPETILSKISEQTFTELSVKNNPANIFSVPENYFDGLADSILGKIKSQPEISVSEVQRELESLSALLAGIAKTNVYSVPDNYFNKLNIGPQQAEVKQAPAKVVELKPRKTWLSVAAAACVVFILGLVGVNFYNNTGKNQQSQVAVAKGNNANFSNLSALNVQNEIAGLSDDEINNYLDKQNNNAVYVNGADNSNNLDVNDLIKTVSDQEIQEYLKDHSVPEKLSEGI